MLPNLFFRQTTKRVLSPIIHQIRHTRHTHHTTRHTRHASMFIRMNQHGNDEDINYLNIDPVKQIKIEENIFTNDWNIKFVISGSPGSAIDFPNTFESLEDAKCVVETDILKIKTPSSESGSSLTDFKKNVFCI